MNRMTEKLRMPAVLGVISTVVGAGAAVTDALAAALAVGTAAIISGIVARHIKRLNEKDDDEKYVSS